MESNLCRIAAKRRKQREKIRTRQGDAPKEHERDERDQRDARDDWFPTIYWVFLGTMHHIWWLESPAETSWAGAALPMPDRDRRAIRGAKGMEIWRRIAIRRYETVGFVPHADYLNIDSNFCQARVANLKSLLTEPGCRTSSITSALI
jgi:hypothetical protein